jgi:hypothetical protein
MSTNLPIQQSEDVGNRYPFTVKADDFECLCGKCTYKRHDPPCKCDEDIYISQYLSRLLICLNNKLAVATDDKDQLQEQITVMTHARDDFEKKETAYMFLLISDGSSILKYSK